MRSPSLAILAAAVVGSFACSGTGDDRMADVVFTGASAIHTGTGDAGGTALAVADGRIVAVGDDATALAHRGPETRVVDLAGAFVVPGLIDGHAHPLGLGTLLDTLDVAGTGTAEEVAGRVAERAAELPAGNWIEGRGWDQTRWPGRRFPDRRVLDAVAPDHPVALARVDGHALWVNGAALRAAGIDAETVDPEGGRILRRPDGSPTGVLIDRAGELVTGAIPELSDADMERRLIAALELAASTGLTGVHDAGVPPRQARVYARLAAEGRLPIRVYGMLEADPESLTVEAIPPVSSDPDSHWTFRSAKLYADGALGSRGAALLDDYADEAGQRGLLLSSPDELESRIEALVERGYQVGVHAIGDRGNRLVLDAFERVIGRRPEADLRLRIEHAQVVALDDLPRFARLGVVASVQPTHATSDMRWAEDRIGPDRVAGAYAWRKLLDSGARVTCGSDFPVESHDPRLGLYAAVTRQDLAGEPAGGWTPEERMTPAEALHCFTAANAWAAFREHDLGTLEVGRLADFVAFGGDPLAVPAAELVTLPVLRTVIGGETVFAAGAPVR